MSKFSKQLPVEANGEHAVQRLFHRVEDSVYDENSYHIGKVLTIIDACIPDQEQRKAIKDLIKDSYYGEKYFWNDRKQVIAQFCSIFKIPMNKNTEEWLYEFDKPRIAEDFFAKTIVDDSVSGEVHQSSK